MNPVRVSHFVGAAAMTLLIVASTLVAVGADGHPVLSALRITSEGAAEFMVDATVGQTYSIAVSSDLVFWSLLTNLTCRGESIPVVDFAAPDHPRRFYQVGLPASLRLNLVPIGPGAFVMGSPSDENGRSLDEGPQTAVRLSRGFWMGRCEVTQEEYVAVMGENPSAFQGDLKRPVEQVRWQDATNYCARLTERDHSAGLLPAGYLYRLPTEAEWEYACRAGTTTPFGVGNGMSLGSSQANFNGSYPYASLGGPYLKRTTAVGSYQPNAWGLQDLHGNVWEWCQDVYGDFTGGTVMDPQGPAAGPFRVVRGGGWADVGYGCRSAQRRPKAPSFRTNTFGFRVVLAPSR